MPVLEHRIGPDVLARWHVRGGRMVLALMLSHGAAAVQAWADSRRQDLSTATVQVLGLPGLAAAAGTALFAAIGAVSVRVARRKLSYERWHGIHLMSYAALALSFVHELAGPNLAGLPVIQVAWSLLYTYALALAFRYRLLAPLLNVWRHRLRVEAVVPEANGVVSLVMSGRHLEELRAPSGQFFRWRFLTASTFHMEHPFSLSSPPKGRLLRITVKHAAPHVQLGAADRRRGRYHSHARAVREPRGGRLTLLDRASGPGHEIFRHELETVAAQRGGEIIWMVGRSADPANQMTTDNLLQLVPDVAQRDLHLCASPAFSRAVRQALAGAQVPRRRIHEEVFAF